MPYIPYHRRVEAVQKAVSDMSDQYGVPPRQVGFTANEMSKYLGCHRTTAYTILQRMVDSGLAYREALDYPRGRGYVVIYYVSEYQPRMIGFDTGEVQDG